ncbi:MAG: glycosyltransferase family 4 protein [Candidatus Eisenbacteria bacterium]|uniref:Glycosyltransferase family 4 protein n=1 Tax=Eiseniibacteriota bacterium TaxID=2212470 RepID=A0A538TAG4_UNCEI|nr:MAG: glycosyltransferase family 4 protein [Candidatus Eisenbacteria bacterium]
MTRPILLIARDYPRMVGGIARYIGRLFSSVPPEDLVVIRHLEPEMSDSERGQRFRVIHTGRYSAFLRTGKLAILPLIVSTVRHVAGERRYRLIVAEQIQTAIPALIAARLLGARLIIFAYGMEITTSRWWRVKGWVFRQADQVVTISSYSRTLLERLGVSSKRIATIPPSVDAEPFSDALQISKRQARARLGISADARVLLSVAVLKQQYKGIDTTIRAASLLRKQYPGLQYLVIGAGPDRPRLEGIALELGLDGLVKFLGSVDEATKGLCYAACDLFVLPNRVEYSRGGERSEGFGIVFLEAALFGRPSIGGQGGSLDAVLHGETGLSVLGTSVEEVAGAAARLLDDPQLREQLSEAGRRRASFDFSTERAAARFHEECIRSLCGSGESREESIAGASGGE